MLLSEITPGAIEVYIERRLNEGKRTNTKLGLVQRGKVEESEGSDYFPPRLTERGTKPHLCNVKKAWRTTLRRAAVPYFALYELRHTFATRLSAGGVSDHFVTLMLRQGDAEAFKRNSQAKLNMMREALSKLDRSANEHRVNFSTAASN